MEYSDPLHLSPENEKAIAKELDISEEQARSGIVVPLDMVLKNIRQAKARLARKTKLTEDSGIER